MSLKNIIKIREFLLAVFALFLFGAIGAVLFGLSPAAAFAEEEGELAKQEFTLTEGDVSCLSDGKAVAVYFRETAFCEEEFDYLFTSGEEEVASARPFLTELDGFLPESVTIVRAEDETYLAFSLTVPVETVSAAAVLTDGQIVPYKASPYEYEGAVFLKDGTETVPFDAGDYEMSVGGKVFPFRIEKSVVTVSVEAFSRKYLESKEYVAVPVVGGRCTEEEKEYVLSHSEFSPKGVSESSGVGSYTVSVVYDGGDRPNFTVLAQDGFYFVTPATLNGFILDGSETLYDGKAHSLTVEYDEMRWPDVSINYNIDEVTDAGKYLYEVTVSKENYEDLVLQAYLTIRTSQLESSNLNNYVCLYGDVGGYDPSTEISLTASTVNGIDETVGSALTESNGYKESIIGSYDVNLSQSVETEEGKGYSVKIKLYGLDSSSGVRILQYDGGEIKQLDYVFENGYFLISTASLKGIVFVKSFPVKANSLSDYILIAVLAALVLIFIGIVISGFSGGRREKGRSRRKHSRWA